MGTGYKLLAVNELRQFHLPRRKTEEIRYPMCEKTNFLPYHCFLNFFVIICATSKGETLGSLIKIWKTISLPPEATVERDGTVTWTIRGKKRTGKLTKAGSVSVQSDIWTAQFTDETGKIQRISTKTTVRSVAEQILTKYQTEVDRIRTGVATRDELSKIHLRHVTFERALGQFRTKMIASGCTPGHIDGTTTALAYKFFS